MAMATIGPLAAAGGAAITPLRVDTVAVSFAPCDAGWQPVAISAGRRETRFEASHFLDPFPEILDWLEVIAAGGDGAVLVDCETSEAHIEARSDDNPAMVFIAVAHRAAAWGSEAELPFDPPELAILIARRVFVAAFYGALRAYALCDDYRPGEWAAVMVGADLRSKGIDVGAAELAAWDAARLQAFLAKLYSVDYVTFPGTSSKRAAIRRFVKLSMGETVSGRIVRTPRPMFDLPDDWDGLPLTDRAVWTRALLEEARINSWAAADLRTLRSGTLDAFLGETVPTTA